MRIVVVALAGCALAACAAKPDAPPPVTPPTADLCGAAALQPYVGKLRSELPPTDASRTRIVCTTCPTTKDYRPDRLNIIYDTASGRIAQINCG